MRLVFRRLFGRRGGALDDDDEPASSWTMPRDTVPTHKVRANLAAAAAAGSRGPEELYVLCLNGSFNPVHVEHVSMLRSAKEEVERLGHAVVGGFLSPSGEDYVNFKKGANAMSLAQRAHLCHIATRGSTWLAATRLGECSGSFAADEVLRMLLDDDHIASLTTAAGTDGVNLHAVQVMGVDTLVRLGYGGLTGSESSSPVEAEAAEPAENGGESKRSAAPAIISIVAVERPGTEIGGEGERQALRARGIVVAPRSAEMSEGGVSSTRVLQMLRESKWQELVWSGMMHPKVLAALRREDDPSWDGDYYSFVLSAALRDRVIAHRPRPAECARNDFPQDIVDANHRIVADRTLTIPATRRFRCGDRCDGQILQASSDGDGAAKESSADKATPSVCVVCVADVDTISAALALMGNINDDNTCILNFANADEPGGLYTMNMCAQEEDVCRLCPQLYPALRDSGLYPIDPCDCLITPDIKVLRQPFTYDTVSASAGCLGTVTVLTAAMPICDGRPPEGGWLSEQSEWCADVRLRVRTVLHAAASTGRRNVVLGAWGCGAFGNDPTAVATLFKQELDRLLRGDGIRRPFDRVVFAILGKNLAPFEKVFAGADKCLS